jgi:hypothetical protein
MSERGFEAAIERERAKGKRITPRYLAGSGYFLALRFA